MLDRVIDDVVDSATSPVRVASQAGTVVASDRGRSCESSGYRDLWEIEGRE